MAPTCQGPYHCPGCATCTAIPAPRRLTASEERRIQRALRDHPPIHGPRPLRLVQQNPETTTYQAPASCDGTYGCDCERCQQQRLVLVRQGHKHVRQPWQAVRRAA
jgi:hypothetical protein